MLGLGYICNPGKLPQELCQMITPLWSHRSKGSIEQVEFSDIGWRLCPVRACIFEPQLGSLVDLVWNLGENERAQWRGNGRIQLFLRRKMAPRSSQDVHSGIPTIIATPCACRMESMSSPSHWRRSWLPNHAAASGPVKIFGRGRSSPGPATDALLGAVWGRFGCDRSISVCQSGQVGRVCLCNCSSFVPQLSSLLFFSASSLLLSTYLETHHPPQVVTIFKNPTLYTKSPPGVTQRTTPASAPNRQVSTRAFPILLPNRHSLAPRRLQFKSTYLCVTVLRLPLSANTFENNVLLALTISASRTLDRKTFLFLVPFSSSHQNVIGPQLAPPKRVYHKHPSLYILDSHLIQTPLNHQYRHHGRIRARADFRNDL